MTLDSFFHPKGIAVIGASDNALKGGFHILRNTLAGYTGPVYPVNPRLGEILSTKCYPDVDSIPENFELAIYFIPAKNLPATIEACARKGARAIIIESAGFSEVGEEGRRLQEESLAGPLFSFNLGIEAGQLMVVAGFIFLGIIALDIFKAKARDWNLVFSGAGFGVSLVLLIERFPV